MNYNLEKLAFVTSKRRLGIIRNDIQAIVNRLTQSCPGVDNRSVVIVAVMGTTDSIYRMLFTDWLIHFCKNQNKEKHSILKYGRVGNMGFISDRIPFNSGVYYWPEFINVPSKAGGDPKLCWILHIEGEDSKFKELIMTTCSHVIVFNEKEKEELKSFIIKSDNQVSKSVQFLSMPDINFVPENKQQESNLASIFFNGLENYFCPSKMVGDGTLLLLSKLVPFLNWTGMNINAKHKTSLWRDVPSPTFDAQEYCSINIPNISAKFVKSVTDRNNCGHIQPKIHSYGVPSTGNEQESKIDEPLDPSDVTASPCTEYRETAIDMVETEKVNCKELEILFINELKDLLERSDISLELKNFPASHAYLKKFDGDSQLAYFLQIFKLVCSYEQVLRNAFDNFICFHGTEDSNRLLSLSNDAFSDATSVLQHQFKVDYEREQKLLFNACSEIYTHYITANQQIAEKELELAVKIKKKVIDQFTVKIGEYHENALSVPSFEAEYGRMLSKLISIISHCMDYDGRLNNVQVLMTNQISNDVKYIYKRKRQQLLHPMVSPQETTSEVLQAVKSYQLNMRRLYQTPEKFSAEVINQHHDDTIKKVSSKLTLDMITEVVDILKEHLVYILELRNEKIQTRKSLSIEGVAKSRTLCVYITKHWIYLFIQASSQIVSFRQGTEQLVTEPSVVALTSKDQLLYGYEANSYITHTSDDLRLFGILDSYIESLEEEEDSRIMLTKFFKSIKSSMETKFGEVFLKILILIPSWYESITRARVFECSSNAGFNETYLFRESAIISFQYMQTIYNFCPNCIIIAVIVAPSSINVEVYGKKCSEEKVAHMLAFASTPFPKALFPRTYANIARQNPERLTYENYKTNENISVPKDATKLLNKTYGRALTQVALHNIQRKYCFLLADSAEWQRIADEFFKAQDDIVLISNERELAAEGAGLLSLNPRQARSIIKDYVSMVSDNHAASHPVSESETSGKFVDRPCSSSGDQSIETESRLGTYNNDASLPKRKQLLSQKCQDMKLLIENGKVKIRRLLQKLILEAVNRAEDSARNPEAKLEEIAYHEHRIGEIITEHNFNL